MVNEMKCKILIYVRLIFLPRNIISNIMEMKSLYKERLISFDPNLVCVKLFKLKVMPFHNPRTQQTKYIYKYLKLIVF